MIINRYGHSAINSWDGTSIEMKEGGDIILAPQVGAGTKNDNNQFTGVLIGDVKSGEKNQQGLFGYHNGQRSIFLDANTGKAQFGKQGAGKIILNPNEKINGKDTALIYSGNYPINDFKNINKGNYNVKATGELQNNRNKDNKGLMIDLSTPQIGFGSGNFTVNSKGQLVARGGGQIAGWTISDDALYKHTNKTQTGIRSNGNPAFYAYNIDEEGNIVQNFYVNHNGYLFSKSGKIAGWNINDKSLFNSNVGMNSDPDNATYAVTGHDSKAFFANGNNFYVTHDGYLRSISGKIAGWDIGTDTNKTNLTNGNTGLGSYVTNITGIYPGDVNSSTGKVTAKIWSGSGNQPNFAVSNNGYIYSKAGRIGGWNITENNLWAGNLNGTASGIRISSTGSIDGGTVNSNSRWSISSSGEVYFNNGTIGGWHITNNNLWTKSNTNNGSGIRINSDGSLNGSNWSIDANGDAYFKYIHGVIDSASGGSASLSNKNGTFSVGNNGNCSFGSGSKALTYDSSNGLLSLGNWEIEGNFIQNKTGNTKIHATQVITGGFSCVSSGGTQNPGVSGTVTFSDGSSLTIMGGIITGVGAGEGAEWD